MIFGRLVSFPGSKIKLFLTLRNSLSKIKSSISSPGRVKIYSKNPKNFTSQTPIATLTPSTMSGGILFVEWDIPETLKKGTYYDSWEEITVEGSKDPETQIKKFFISDSLYSTEDLLEDNFEINISKRRIYTDSKEYVVFNLVKPEELIFNKTEARITAPSSSGRISSKVVMRELGPGQNYILNSNALFPKDPLNIIETTSEEKTSFFEIPNIDRKAYFIFDTLGLTEGVYKIQLRFSFGEESRLTRTFSIIIENPI